MTTFTWETREQWGAAQPRNRRTDVAPRGVAIHYPGPGGFAFKEHDSCRYMLRRWQEMHMARGSNDLEYGLILCRHLRLMEGRIEQDRPTVRVGSNGTAAANYTHTSVQLMRGTDDPPPTDAEIRALGEAVAWLREHGGWGPQVTGHRDHYATACPGDALYRRLPDIRRIADEGIDMPLTDAEKDDIARRTARLVLREMEWAHKAGADRLGLAAHVTRLRRQSDRLVAALGEPEPDPDPDPEPEPCDGYTVAKGDTLSRIAAAHNISLGDLLAANPQITDPNRIEVGDCIAVPKAPTPATGK